MRAFAAFGCAAAVAACTVVALGVGSAIVRGLIWALGGHR